MQVDGLGNENPSASPIAFLGNPISQRPLLAAGPSTYVRPRPITATTVTRRGAGCERSGRKTTGDVHVVRVRLASFPADS